MIQAHKITCEREYIITSANLDEQAQRVRSCEEQIAQEFGKDINDMQWEISAKSYPTCQGGAALNALVTIKAVELENIIDLPA